MGSEPLHGMKVVSASVGTFPSDNPEVAAHLLVIRLEVLLNVDNESGCNCGEQTDLYPHENCINTATDVCTKRILTKINVVFGSSSYFFIKSRSYPPASRWNLS